MVCLLLVQGSAIAGEVDDRSARAKLLYRDGMAHFQLDEWDSAIERWEEGFRLVPAPELLYNLAQAYRMSKRPEKALAFYQKFLRASPTAPNRAEVERHISRLTNQLEQQRLAEGSQPDPLPRAPQLEHPPEPASPAPVVHAEPEAIAPVAPAPLSHVNATAPASGADMLVVASEPGVKRPTPHRKKVLIGVIVGAGAVVIAGTALGLALGLSRSPAPLDSTLGSHTVTQ